MKRFLFVLPVLFIFSVSAHAQPCGMMMDEQKGEMKQGGMMPDEGMMPVMQMMPVCQQMVTGQAMMMRDMMQMMQGKRNPQR